MNRFYRGLVLCLIVLATHTWVSQAHANILNNGGGPGANNPANCGVSNWDWNLGAGAEAGPNRCAPNWLIVPKSPAGPAGGPKALSFDLQHLVAVPGHGAAEIAPNPALPVNVPAGMFAAGVSRAGAHVRSHPGLAHHDVYQWTATIPVGGGAVGGVAEISAKAKHIAAPFPPKWSYVPAEIGGPANIVSVTASYPTDPPKSAEGVPPVDQKIRNKHEGDLPLGKTGERPTDYTVRVTLGDPFSSQMTLAYITVDEFGVFSEADLAVMNEFFVPGEEFLVPMLFDVNQTMDLFIGVDLTQWLSFPTSFSIGDTYSFTNGMSDLLPGFFVATSQVDFDPVAGMFTSGDPLDGSAIAFGTVDGGNDVPEPSTSLLFGAGLFGLLYADWRRRKRVG